MTFLFSEPPKENRDRIDIKIPTNGGIIKLSPGGRETRRQTTDATRAAMAM